MRTTAREGLAKRDHRHSPLRASAYTARRSPVLSLSLEPREPRSPSPASGPVHEAETPRLPPGHHRPAGLHRGGDHRLVRCLPDVGRRVDEGVVRPGRRGGGGGTGDPCLARGRQPACRQRAGGAQLRRHLRCLPAAGPYGAHLDLSGAADQLLHRASLDGGGLQRAADRGDATDPRLLPRRRACRIGACQRQPDHRVLADLRGPHAGRPRAAGTSGRDRRTDRRAEPAQHGTRPGRRGGAVPARRTPLRPGRAGP